MSRCGDIVWVTLKFGEGGAAVDASTVGGDAPKLWPAVIDSIAMYTSASKDTREWRIEVRNLVLRNRVLMLGDDIRFWLAFTPDIPILRHPTTTLPKPSLRIPQSGRS